MTSPKVNKTKTRLKKRFYHQIHQVKKQDDNRLKLNLNVSIALYNNLKSYSSGYKNIF